MSEQDRDALIDLKLHQADDIIKLVGFLVSADKMGLAVNRIYFGMYHGLSALAIKHNMDHTSHRQLMRWFQREFVSTGKTDVLFGKIYRNAFYNMIKADQDVFVKFPPIQMESLQAEMIQFKDEMKRLLS